jgi:hypothetical protein
VPSDTSGERLVTSALVVMPAGKPIPSYQSALGADVGSPVGSARARAAMGRTVADRGSTGGLLSWSPSGR